MNVKYAVGLLIILFLATIPVEGATLIAHFNATLYNHVSFTLYNHTSLTFKLDKYAVNVSNISFKVTPVFSGSVLDNSGGGSWGDAVVFPINGTLPETTNYKIVINGSTIYLENATGGVKASVNVSNFWNMVNTTWMTDIRVFNQSSELYYWVEYPIESNCTPLTINTTAGISSVSQTIYLPEVLGEYAVVYGVVKNESTSPISVSVSVNGNSVATIDLTGKKYGGFRVIIPTSYLVSNGENTITYSAVGTVDKAVVLQSNIKYVSNKVTIWVKATKGSKFIGLAFNNSKAKRSQYLNPDKCFYVFDNFTNLKSYWRVGWFTSSTTTDYLLTTVGGVLIDYVNYGGPGPSIYGINTTLPNLTNVYVEFRKYSTVLATYRNTEVIVNAIQGWFDHQHNEYGNVFYVDNGSAFLRSPDFGDGTSYETYSITFESGVAKFYINGKLVWSYVGTYSPTPPFTDIAIRSSSWGLPITQFVDYVFVANSSDPATFSKPCYVYNCRVSVNNNVVINTSVTTVSKEYSGSYKIGYLFNYGNNTITTSSDLGDYSLNVQFNYTYEIPQVIKKTTYDEWVNFSEFYIPYNTDFSCLEYEFNTYGVGHAVKNFDVYVYVNGHLWKNFTLNSTLDNGLRIFRLKIVDLPCGDPTVSVHVVFPSYIHVNLTNENTLESLNDGIVRITVCSPNFSVINSTVVNTSLTSEGVVKITYYEGKAIVRARDAVYRQSEVNITPGLNVSTTIYIPTTNYVLQNFKVNCKSYNWIVVKKYVGFNLTDIDVEKIPINHIVSSYLIEGDPYYIYVANSTSIKFVGFVQPTGRLITLNVSRVKTNGAVVYSISNNNGKIVVTYATISGITKYASVTIYDQYGSIVYSSGSSQPSGRFVFNGDPNEIYIVHLKIVNTLQPVDITVPMKSYQMPMVVVKKESNNLLLLIFIIIVIVAIAVLLFYLRSS